MSWKEEVKSAIDQFSMFGVKAVNNHIYDGNDKEEIESMF